MIKHVHRAFDVQIWIYHNNLPGLYIYLCNSCHVIKRKISWYNPSGFPKIPHGLRTFWSAMVAWQRDVSAWKSRWFKSMQRPKLYTCSVCNIMDNGIKYSVVQLWHKSKTTLIVGLRGQGLNSCGLSYHTNNSCGFPLFSVGKHWSKKRNWHCVL